VAAAIVLREGMNADEREIREFASARLAPFKLPRKMVIVEDIPKGATGKVQRARLAEALGLGDG
jgi:acyl-CoA synthetase (AMP-forming)/AMP-acid ligase II